MPKFFNKHLVHLLFVRSDGILISVCLCFRSFQGISCLIQVSTHSKDYIIDPFDIWADLTLFNEITANPKIVKVRLKRS